MYAEQARPIPVRDDRRAGRRRLHPHRNRPCDRRRRSSATTPSSCRPATPGRSTGGTENDSISAAANIGSMVLFGNEGGDTIDVRRVERRRPSSAATIRTTAPTASAAAAATTSSSATAATTLSTDRRQRHDGRRLRQRHDPRLPSGPRTWCSATRATTPSQSRPAATTPCSPATATTRSPHRRRTASSCSATKATTPSTPSATSGRRSSAATTRPTATTASPAIGSGGHHVRQRRRRHDHCQPATPTR